MTATVRSVRVVLEAEIAKYVADMKLAGRATREAFGGNNNQPAWAAKALGEVEQSAKKAGTTARKTGQDFEGMGAKARAAGKDVDDLGTKARKTEREIDRMSGRVRLLGEGLLTIGPALIPLTAGALPAVTGLAAGFGAAAGGAGVMALAFSGVGDALKALNDYQLEPTQAHLQALRESMGKVGSDGRQFVRFLDSASGGLRELQFIARDNMFPGVEEGITSLLKDLPAARRLVAGLSAEVGKLSAEAGDALAGDKWAGFIDYVGTDAQPTLDALGHTVGNVALGFANLFVAFAPATRDFTSGLEHASKAFADWSANVDDTKDFKEFLSYVRTEGPEAIDLLEALASMLLGVAHAAAPVGEAVLPVFTDLAKIIGVISKSPLGPPLYAAATAMVVLGRATKIAEAGMARFEKTSGTTKTGLLGISRTAGGIVAVAAAVTALGNSLAAATGAKLDISDLDRNLTSIAQGRGDKTLERITADFRNLNGSLTNIADGKAVEPLKELVTGFGFFGNTPLDNASDNIKAVDQALASLVESGNADKAKEIFDDIVQSITGGSVPGGSVAPGLMKDIEGQFNSYTTAVENAKGPTDAVSGSIASVGQASKRTKADIDGLVSAMRDHRTAALAAFDAETQWREALKAAAKQAKASNAGIRGSSDAALANREALSGLAAAWNNQSDAVKNNSARFRAAKKAFIDTAVGMNVPIAQAKRLADRLLEIPRARVAKVTADTGQAMSAVAALKSLMDSLHDRDIHVRVTKTTNATVAEASANGKKGHADGGTVPGPRQPYGDKTLIMAAPGEEVITNRHGEADRFRADRAAGRIPAYASGGTVGRTPGGQLTGLGSYLQPAELAHRIADYLGANQIRGLGRQIDDLSKKNLTRLAKALDKASTLQEKQTQAASDAFGAVQSKRSGYASDIRQGLTRDIFAGGGSAFDGQFATGSVASVNQQLGLQNQDARDFARLERILQERGGLHGEALQQVLAGGIDRVRTFAAASTSQLRTYQQRYDTAYGSGGSVTAAANYGAAALTPEFNALKTAYDEQTAELKAILQELKVAQKTRKEAPAQTAKHINSGARSARRG